MFEDIKIDNKINSTIKLAKNLLLGLAEDVEVGDGNDNNND